MGDEMQNLQHTQCRRSHISFSIAESNPKTPRPDKMHIMEGSYKLNRFSIQLYREYKNGMLSCIKSDEDSASTLRQKSVMVSEICLDMMKFCYTKWVFTVHF